MYVNQALSLILVALRSHRPLMPYGGVSQSGGSTMYDALGKTRTTLSPLRSIHRIVAACAQDAVDNWIEA
jgi:hypothetical protein